jgi:hypothetical protein
MSPTKSASSSEFELDLRIGRAEEDKSIVRNLHKAASDVPAAMFALELIKQSNTPRAELVSKSVTAILSMARSFAQNVEVPFLDNRSRQKNEKCPSTPMLRKDMILRKSLSLNKLPRMASNQRSDYENPVAHSEKRIWEYNCRRTRYICCFPAAPPRRHYNDCTVLFGQEETGDKRFGRIADGW